MRAFAMVSTIVAVFGAALTASAHPQSTGSLRSEPVEPEEAVGSEDALDYVVIPPQPKHRAAGLANKIYLNRCPGGCVIGTGANDASADRTTIAKRQGRLTEFSFGDAAWTSLVQCVQRAYEQYAVEVTTQEPGAGDKYVEVMVAGFPEDIGFPQGTLGIAPLTSDCSPVHNVLAFAFSEAHRTSTIIELCATVAHEAGHAFGLDHALQCRDPMTYLASCGERLFLNIESKCGEFRKSRNCRCGDVQNSHVKLLNELGPSGIAPPIGSVALERLPQWDGSLIVGRVLESRWLRAVELWINGRMWTRLPHTPLIDVRIPAPPVSDGVLDIEMRVINDLGGIAKDTYTITKGAPCTSSAACAAGEECRDGRCVFPPPTGPLGMLCSEDSECASWECYSLEKERRCAMVCSPGLVANECPEGFTCVRSEEPHPGACWPTDKLPESGGCASGTPAPALPGLLLALGALFGLRRRRRQR